MSSYQIKQESLTKEQRQIHGLSGSARLWMLLYADNIVLFSKNIEELQGCIEIYNNTLKRFGLKIATDKTKTIAFNLPE